MPLQTEGPISIGDIKSEFGGTATNLTAYRKGAGIVKDLTLNVNVPESGPIGITDLYGATVYKYANISISAINTSRWDNFTDITETGNWTFGKYEVASFDIESNIPKEADLIVPAFTMKMRGDEDEKLFSGDDHNGIRNVGWMLHDPDGNEVFRLQSTSYNRDDGGFTSITFPTQLVNIPTAVQGDYKLYFISETMRGGANLIYWISPQLLVILESAGNRTVPDGDIVVLNGQTSGVSDDVSTPSNPTGGNDDGAGIVFDIK